MFKKNINYNTRKFHRYFGVFIGIQFLFWTLGGLYFSWNNMDDVHGDTFIKHQTSYVNDFNFSNIRNGIDSLKIEKGLDSIISINFIDIMNHPMAQLRYFFNGRLQNQLINANTGELRAELTGQECLELVENKLSEPIPIIKAELLQKNSTGDHHEYRGKPLPAYAFTLDHHTKTTIYVSTELGEITSVRNNNWRRFDFLWMLHTMDYTTRDYITNWVLRVFSVLGLITVLSGFYLFYLTSPLLKKSNKERTI